MTALKTETIPRGGREFLVSLYPDDDVDPPWETEEGHGQVEYQGSSRCPIPRGWTVLYNDPRGPGRWVYNFGAALVQASREGWGLSPDQLARLGPKPSRGKIRAETVRTDMAHLRGYIVGDWCYIGVCVQIIGPDGRPEGTPFDYALWGVESEGDYWREVADELADEILHHRREKWRKTLSEARARKYWESRDIITIGA